MDDGNGKKKENTSINEQFVIHFKMSIHKSFLTTDHLFMALRIRVHCAHSNPNNGQNQLSLHDHPTSKSSCCKNECTRVSKSCKDPELSMMVSAYNTLCEMGYCELSREVA